MGDTNAAIPIFERSETHRYRNKKTKIFLWRAKNHIWLLFVESYMFQISEIRRIIHFANYVFCEFIHIFFA